ncbi:MAG: DNA internalization-related competence protein ComEC/Rec2, partial [Gammaproteobacteria bacterium]
LLPAQLVGHDILITGIVSEFPRTSTGIQRFHVELIPEPRGRLPQRIYLAWYADTPEMSAGSCWQLRVRLRQPRGLSNPGGFNYARWLYSRGIGATGYVRRSALNKPVSCGRNESTILDFRAQLARRLQSVLGNSPHFPILLGLALGTRHLLSDDQWAYLRATGTTHLMAISGLHIGLAAALFMWLGRLLGGGLLFLGMRWQPITCGRLGAVAGAFAYGLLSGLSVSALRALVMLLIAVALVLSRREVNLLNVLSATLLIALVINPLMIFEQGFWLSFGAVASIGFAFAGRVSGDEDTDYQHNRWVRAGWIIRRLGRAQLIFTLGLAPLVLYMFGELSLLGPLVNLLLIPVFAFVLVPGILLGVLLFVFWEAAGVLLLQCCLLLIQAVFFVLETCAGLDWSLWRPGTATVVALLLAWLGVGVVIAPVALPLRGLLCSLFLPVVVGLRLPSGESGLRLTVLDVGQGLAAVVQTADHTLIYDTGPAYRSSDAGQNVVIPFFRHTGLRKPDLIVVSHGDSDHSGGLASLVSYFPDTPVISPAASQLRGVSSMSCTRGLAWNWDEVSFHFVYPEEGSVRSGNNASCVLLIQFDGHAILLPGDIEASVEHLVAGRLRDWPIDLVVVPHHGSKTSSSPALVAAVKPKFAVFSNGYGNRWGFPHADVARRWSAAGACMLATADFGALRFSVQPGRGLILDAVSRPPTGFPWETQNAPPEPCGSPRTVL